MRWGLIGRYPLGGWFVLASVFMAPAARAQNPPEPPTAVDAAQSMPAREEGKPGQPQEGSAPSAEQQAKAKDFYLRGAALYAKGQYEAALLEFTYAYKVTPLPDLLFNLARTEEKLNRPADAAKHYREFLKRSPNDPDAENVRAKIAQLEQMPSSGGPRRFPVYSAIAGGGTLLFTIIGAAALGSAQAQYNVFARTCAPSCPKDDVLALQPTAQTGAAFLSLAGAGAAATIGLLIWELRRSSNRSKSALLVGPWSLARY